MGVGGAEGRRAIGGGWMGDTQMVVVGGGELGQASEPCEPRAGGG